MRIAVFDTETTNIVKPYCYNVGVVLFDTETGDTVKREWVIEQIWHNMELFNTAYYANKRPIYVKAMRAKKIKMTKWGYVCQEMARLFKDFGVECAYAYNSPFDDKVFQFNCEWFKTQNPFDNVPIFDIRGLVHKYIAFTPSYQHFCERYNFFTETGNYSTTAENVYRFLQKNVDFIEDHTALSDSEIELQILLDCIDMGGELNKEYKVYTTIPRKVQKILRVISKESISTFEYEKIRINKERTEIKLW